MIKYWMLMEDHTTRVTTNVVEWAQWFEKADRVVAQVEQDGFFISTVFIGINHNWGEGPPHIFETMVFYGPGADTETIDMLRASTWDDAVAQHNAMVRKHLTARQSIVKEQPKEKTKSEKGK